MFTLRYILWKKIITSIRYILCLEEEKKEENSLNNRDGNTKQCNTSGLGLNVFESSKQRSLAEEKKKNLINVWKFQMIHSQHRDICAVRLGTAHTHIYLYGSQTKQKHTWHQENYWSRQEQKNLINVSKFQIVCSQSERKHTGRQENYSHFPEI